MQDPPNSGFGLVGVAPEATLRTYRVFGCDGGVVTDIMMLASEQALTDKVDILSISVASLEKWGEYDVFANTTAGLEAAVIAVIVADENKNSRSLLSTVQPFHVVDTSSMQGFRSLL